MGMRVAGMVVSVVLAALLVWTAVRKLSHREDVVRSYTRLGVPEDKLNYLAVILLAGAAGLVAGLVWAPIGIAAAGGLVCYFIAASGVHIRAGDAKNLPTPVGFGVMAAAALVLRLAAM
jgi:hypothetical protein